MYLEELQIFYLAQLFRYFSVGLCLGTSTIAMTFYFYVVAQGQTEPAQNRMMHVVYTVLRVGMVFAIVSEVAGFMYYYHIDNFIYWTDNPELLMRLTIFAIIVLNAYAMQHRRITMWLGPAFAGGSWYAYFFFSVWIETESTYPTLFVGYLMWLMLVFAFVTSLRLVLTRHQKRRIGDGAVSISNKSGVSSQG